MFGNDCESGSLVVHCVQTRSSCPSGLGRLDAHRWSVRGRAPCPQCCSNLSQHQSWKRVFWRQDCRMLHHWRSTQCACTGEDGPKSLCFCYVLRRGLLLGVLRQDLSIIPDLSIIQRGLPSSFPPFRASRHSPSMLKFHSSAPLLSAFCLLHCAGTQ